MAHLIHLYSALMHGHLCDSTAFLSW